MSVVARLVGPLRVDTNNKKNNKNPRFRFHLEKTCEPHGLLFDKHPLARKNLSSPIHPPFTLNIAVMIGQPAVSPPERCTHPQPCRASSVRALSMSTGMTHRSPQYATGSSLASSSLINCTVPLARYGTRQHVCMKRKRPMMLGDDNTSVIFLGDPRLCNAKLRDHPVKLCL